MFWDFVACFNSCEGIWDAVLALTILICYGTCQCFESSKYFLFFSVVILQESNLVKKGDVKRTRKRGWASWWKRLEPVMASINNWVSFVWKCCNGYTLAKFRFIYMRIQSGMMFSRLTTRVVKLKVSWMKLNLRSYN